MPGEMFDAGSHQVEMVGDVLDSVHAGACQPTRAWEISGNNEAVAVAISSGGGSTSRAGPPATG